VDIDDADVRPNSKTAILLPWLTDRQQLMLLAELKSWTFCSFIVSSLDKDELHLKVARSIQQVLHIVHMA